MHPAYGTLARVLNLQTASMRSAKKLPLNAHAQDCSRSLTPMLVPSCRLVDLRENIFWSNVVAQISNHVPLLTDHISLFSQNASFDSLRASYEMFLGVRNWKILEGVGVDVPPIH